jgi:hypothetical protein
VIPVFARRNGYFQYSIDVCPPIWVSRRASRDDLRAGAALALADLERFLEKNPTQWFHFG